MIFIVVKWRPKAEYVESFTDEVAEFTNATRNEPGNMFFEWSRSLEDPAEYVLVEGFRDGDAGKQFFIGAPVGRHTLATGSHHSVPGAQSAELTAGEIMVTNASGAIPAAATDAIRRTIFFM